MKKGKRDFHSSFVRLPREILLRRPEWWHLQPHSRDLYVLLKSKYNGGNNGEVGLSYSEILKKKIEGLSSPKGISAGFAELERTGWIRRTFIGGLYRRRCLYALTGQIDKML